MSLTKTLLSNAKAMRAAACDAYYMELSENPQNVAKLASLWADKEYWEGEVKRMLENG